MTTTAITQSDLDGELLTQLVARRRRRTPVLTAVLAVALAAAAAFVGGVEIQKHYGSSSASGGGGGANLASLASRFAARSGGTGTRTSSGGTGGFGAFFGGGAGGGATVGTVTLIKGNDIYVTDSSGTTTIVHTANASVTKSVAGSVKSIAPGDTVTVVGTQGSNGSTTARSITVNGNG
ncbi:MAG TPA: hypothetical protein VGH52_07970 [Gaiellaceae bacterium]|jgi:hypothetical protein